MSNGKFIDDAPAGASGWRDVWREDRQYRSGGGVAAFLRRMVRKVTQPDLDRQRNFNLVLLDLLADVRADATAQVEALRGDLAALRRDMRGDIDSVLRDLRSGDEALAADIRRTHELIPVAARRNDALISALDQKIETLAVRVRDITNPVVFGDRAAPADFTYRRIEDALRGSSDAISTDVRPYVLIAEKAQPLLDVGCGRGELLAACRDAGIRATGFDTNERSVADLRSRGLDASVGGVPECFADLADASIGSIAAIHVVEHLPAEILFALFREAGRVLRTGGVLMIETPNAESLLMSASDFWRDPTHLAPRHPAALSVLAREHGFAIEELRAVHEFPEGTRLAIQPDDPPGLQRVIHALNERLFAPQDLRMIARKG